MKRLVNNESASLANGRHQYVINITSGTVQLQISTDKGVTFQDMTNGLFSASEDGIILSANVLIKAVISATATVDIGFIGY